MDPRMAQLVTLHDASIRIGKPGGYFTIRRSRWRDHDEHPFPQPVAVIAGHDVYDLQTLVVWDAARKNRDAARRAAWQANRQQQEA